MLRLIVHAALSEAMNYGKRLWHANLLSKTGGSTINTNVQLTVYISFSGELFINM